MSDQTINQTMCDGSVPNQSRGILYLVMGTVYLPIYLLVIWAMCKQPLRSQSCYKLMISIGCMDVTLLIMNGYVAGYWSIIGATYCQHYWTMKVAGAIVGGAWTSYMCLCLVLAFNRVQQSANMSGTENSLFTGSRTFMWIGLCLLLAAIHTSGYLGPHLTLVYESSSGLWQSASSFLMLSIFLHFLQNTVFSIVIVILYAVLVYRIWKLSHIAENTPITPEERDIYVQSALISLFTVVLSVSYLIVPLVTRSQTVFLVLQLYNMFVEGSNPFIYLIFNRTVRNTLRSAICPQTTVHTVTIEAGPAEEPSNGVRVLSRPATARPAPNIDNRLITLPGHRMSDAI